MSEPVPTSLCEVAEGIRQGRLCPIDLVEQCLDRIARWEPILQAWVRVQADPARSEARRRQAQQAAGQPLGPLHGIPLGIKDIIDVANWPTEAGSPLLAGQPAAGDAPAVARLRAAGAIFLGKTVTTPFAHFDPAATRNPWNRQHTPGGSSSGSAAAVATRMCWGALGSQTGGSIIRPAAYCGIAGLKPTRGLVDTRGVVSLSRHLDHLGPLAPRVADLRLLLSVLADQDLPRQPRSQPPRLLVIQDPWIEQADAAVQAATQAALERLEHAGAALQTLQLPPAFRNLHAMHRLILAVETAENHFSSFAQNADSYTPEMASLIEEGLGTAAIDYSLALRHQELFQQQWTDLLQDGRIALMPSTTTPAPAGLQSTGDPGFASPWSYAGCPALTLPCGLAPGRLPCGLQLIAAAGHDASLLNAAEWCENVLDFSLLPDLDASP